MRPSPGLRRKQSIKGARAMWPGWNQARVVEARADDEIFMLGILDDDLVKGFLQRSAGRAGAGWLTQKEVVKRPYFPVTSVLMPPHEPRHSYELCIVCHKPFRVYRSRLLRSGGMFCTQRCFWQAWRAFRRALAKGQLEDILELPVSQEVLKTDAPATRRRLAVRR